MVMQPVPYEIREDDVDEVIGAHEASGGGDWPEERRAEARAHVMRNVAEIDETVRTALEDPRRGSDANRSGPISDHPGDRAPDRRDAALAAIEDLLIRDGYIEIEDEDDRAF